MGEESDTCTHDEVSDMPLDPIDPDLVGACRVKGVIRSAHECGFECLLPGLCFLEEQNDKKQSKLSHGVLSDLRKATQSRHHNQNRRIVATRAQYQRHFDSLLECGVLAKATHMPSFFSSYFAVRKSAKSSRSIFNGRRLSSMGPPPPSINLPSLIDFCPLIDEFLRSNERVYAHSGDLRHWFHQLPLPTKWHPFFGLRLGRQDFTWCVLPMGWAYSPYVAQCYALMLLCGRHETQKSIFEESVLKDGHSGPPKFLEVRHKGKRVALALVYYDNFLILTSQEDLHVELRARVSMNKTRFNMRLKEEDISVLQDGSGEVEFLGVIFRKGPKSSMVRPRKMESWNEEAPKESDAHTSMPLKKLLTCGGRLLFIDMMIFDRVQTTTRAILRELSRVGEQCQWRDVPINGTLCHTIVQAWKEVEDLQLTPRARLHHSDERPEVIIATDASLRQGGVCIYLAGERVLCRELQFPKEVSQWSIFGKELWAAMMGLKIGKELYPDHSVVLVLDNSGVNYVIGNGVCTNPRYESILVKIGELPSPRKTILVISPDNPSDVPTRVDSSWSGPQVQLALAQREKLMFHAIESAEKGGQWASVERASFCEDLVETPRALRHEI